MKVIANAAIVVLMALVAACSVNSNVATPDTESEEVAGSDTESESEASEEPSTETSGSNEDPQPEPPEQIDPAPIREAHLPNVYSIQSFACDRAFSLTGYRLPTGLLATAPTGLVGVATFLVDGDVGIQLQGQEVAANGLAFASTPEFSPYEAPIGEAAADQSYVALYVDADGSTKALQLDAGQLTDGNLVFAAIGIPALLGAPVFNSEGNYVGSITDLDNSIVVVSPYAGARETVVPAAPRCPSASTGVTITAADLVPTDLQLLAVGQDLASALAADNWDLVRRLEPARVDYTDNQFIEGWGTLNRSTLVPAEWGYFPQSAGPGEPNLRALLVAHETDGGEQVTKLFCISWAVELDGLGSGTVIETTVDTLNGLDPSSDRYDPLLATLPGWIDPLEAAAGPIAACG